MKTRRVPKSPVYPRDHKWALDKRKGYESEVTALVRAMRRDSAILEDQGAAWDRWRKEPGSSSSA